MTASNGNVSCQEIVYNLTKPPNRQCARVMKRFLATTFPKEYTRVVELIASLNGSERLNPQMTDDSLANLTYYFASHCANASDKSVDADARYFREVLFRISSTFRTLRERKKDWPDSFAANMIEACYRIDRSFLYAYTVLALDIWNEPTFATKFVAIQNPNPERSLELFGYMGAEIVNEYKFMLTMSLSNVDLKDIALRATRLAVPYVDLGCLARPWQTTHERACAAVPGQNKADLEPLVSVYAKAVKETLIARFESPSFPPGISRMLTETDLGVMQFMLSVPPDPNLVLNPPKPVEEKRSLADWSEAARAMHTEKFLKVCSLFESWDKLRAFGQERRIQFSAEEDIVDGDGPEVIGTLARLFWYRSDSFVNFFGTRLFQLTLFYNIVNCKLRGIADVTTPIISCFRKTNAAMKQVQSADVVMFGKSQFEFSHFSPLAMAMSDIILGLVKKHADENEYLTLKEIVDEIARECMACKEEEETTVREEAVEVRTYFHYFCSSCLSLLCKALLRKHYEVEVTDEIAPGLGLFIIWCFVRKGGPSGKPSLPTSLEKVRWRDLLKFPSVDEVAKSFCLSQESGELGALFKTFMGLA